MNKIAELRKEAHITQEKFASIIGVARSTIAMYETNKSEPDFSVLQKIADYFNVSVDYLLGRDEKSLPERKGKWINVYGSIAAGIPIEAIEDIVDQEEISEEMASHGEYIALKVKGDSMEPKISDGDTVIIKIQDTLESGEIGAVYVNGNDVTLKRVRFEDNGIWLIGNNPSFQPIFYSKRQCNELPVRILGKLVELRAKF